MKTFKKFLAIGILLLAIGGGFGARADEAGYTSDNESQERVNGDKTWDAEQDEFDKPWNNEELPND